MQPVYSRNKIVENINITGGIYKMTVSGEFDTRPGQFYNLKSWDREPLLPRPISIYDATESTVSFLYEVRGTGTKLLAKLQEGDELELVGPLGNCFDMDALKDKKVAMIAGGIGIAPFLYLSKALKAAGTDATVHLYAGFRDKSYAIDEFEPYIESAGISTDFGTEGHKGFVTDLVDVRNYDVVLACGPEIMMNKVVKMCREKNVECVISMEAHMACGIGACLVCACKTVDGMKRTCKDGPIFNGRDVMINE